MVSLPGVFGASTPKTDLSLIRKRVLSVEKDLIQGLQGEKHTRNQIGKIRELIRLQKQERQAAKSRMSELEKTLLELESRRAILRGRIDEQKLSLKRTVKDLHKSVGEQPSGGKIEEREIVESPRRRVIAYLASAGVREIEMLRADLEDAERIELRIEEEKQQLAYLLQDLEEQESVLSFNQQLHADLLKKRHEERVARLVEYRKLKDAEAKIEQLIQDFNARVELDQIQKAERDAQLQVRSPVGSFLAMKGKLPVPVRGEIISHFGKGFDAKTSLNLFKKGLEFSVKGGTEVKTVSSGSVAYSGMLPGYGQVAIVDHGDGFYSVSANLGKLLAQKGSQISSGDVIGMTEESGKPFYFEIRSRNIPVDPLQWITN